MKALVAGATGHTGRQVVRVLCERNIETVAHVRPESARREQWRERFGAMAARVDLTSWEPDAIEATLRRESPALVFALLGTTRARARRAERLGRDASYESVDYGLTSLLLRATVRAVPAARFIFLSSIGVKQGRRNPYLRAKARIEEELARSGLEWVVARPSFITGPDREESRPVERTLAIVSDTLLGIALRLGMQRLHDRYASMTGAELAEALVRIALDPAAAKRVFEADQLRRQ